jgi:prepilin-type processing-associated H-X9-DG protein
MAFRTEEQIRQPARTPLFADAANIWWLSGWWGPQATDLPAVNLQTGQGSAGAPAYGMSTFTIPRHGSRPNSISMSHPPNQLLPGAINVAFYDGHVEQVKLERLWQLYWHFNYQPPAKRPGL